MAATAYEFLTERNARLATALGTNPEVAKFVQAVLEHLIDRAETTGAALSTVEVEAPRITQEGQSYYVSAKIT